MRRARIVRSQAANSRSSCPRKPSKLPALLDAWQMQRLKQIALQQQGPRAFRHFEVITALHLTADQRTQIAKIIDEEVPRKPHEPMRNSERPDRPPRAEPRFDDRPPPREGRGRHPPRGEGLEPRERDPPGDPDDGLGPPFGLGARRPSPRRGGPLDGPNDDRTMHETMEERSDGSPRRSAMSSKRHGAS